MDTMSAYDIHGLTRRISTAMYERHGIIMTVGVYAVATGENRRAELQSKVMQTLAAHKDIVQVHGFYYSDKDKYLSVDVVPDSSHPRSCPCKPAKLERGVGSVTSVGCFPLSPHSTCA